MCVYTVCVHVRTCGVCVHTLCAWGGCMCVYTVCVHVFMHCAVMSMHVKPIPSTAGLISRSRFYLDCGNKLSQQPMLAMREWSAH